MRIPGHRLTVTLLLGVAASAQAQRPDSGSLGDRVVHETWTRGLPGNWVRRVHQARDGYLWLATDGGLVRFDGVRFEVHQAPALASADSLPDNYLNNLTEASDGALWLATWHGGVVEFRNGRFRTFGSDQGLPDDETNFVFEDRRGTIWAGTRLGLARKAGDRFAPFVGTPSTSMYTMAEDDSGTLWLGAESGVLLIRDGRVERLAMPPLGGPRVLRIMRARDGAMWVATAQGLVRMQRSSGGAFRTTRVYNVRDGLRSSYVTSVAEQLDGVIWAGTLGGGIARLDRDDRFRSLGAGEGLADNNVSDVSVDREGSVWAGTVDGLTRIREPTLSNWRSTGFWTTSDIWSVNALADGTVWVGTGSDGAVRIGKDRALRTYSLHEGLPSEVVYTSFRRRDGSLWLGTKRGIVKLVGDRFVDETAALGLAPIGVRTITEDSRGRFWIGTDSNLTVDGPRGRMSLIRRKWLLPGRIYTLAEDGAHQVWVACGNLLRVVGDSLLPFVSAQGDSMPEAMDIYPDTVGMWVSGYQRGLAIVRGDSMHFFPTKQTGVVKEVLRILDDGRGSLWLTSSDGLQRVRKADLLAYLRDTSYRVRTRLFTKLDGLRSHDFAKAGNTSGTRGPDGRLWLPTTAGIVVLDPANIAVDGTVPHVYVERVFADGAALAPAAVARLPRGTHQTRFEFTSTSLAAPSRVRLWYKLEGVDSDWRAADPLAREATYQDLPRGRFRFVVRSENADGVPSAAPAEMTIVSTPPLTRSAWFWALLVGIVGTAAAAAYRWRVGRLRAHATFLQGVIDDRTEALAARQRLEHQLLHAQKLESVGRLAGGVAHDLNNLLTAIVGHAELALGEQGLSEAVRADVGEVRTVAARAASLTRQLLTFARKQVVQPRLLRLGVLVANIEKLVRRLLTEDIALETESREGDWAIRADPNQVEQVIVNLAVNARDAMPEGGSLRIRSQAVFVDDAFVEPHPEFAPGDYVMLEVADSGTGMTAEVMAHLFEPFFTTKEAGKGTGLGLATSFGIVTQSGGHILVESREGDGTTFKVYFPRAAGDVALERVAVPSAMPRGTERLLMVEDEGAVRDVAERTLRALGYEVTTARDGLEAIERLEMAKGAFSLVLTDLRMPRLGGTEMAARVRARWPRLPIVYMSGHAEAMLDGDALGANAVLLRKPFTASELAVCIRTALDRA